VSECPAGCCPHDSASLVEGCPGDLPGAPLPERVAHLRACQLLSVRRIAAVTGVDRQRITQLLYEVAIEDRPRGAWRRTTRRTRTAGDERLEQVLARLSEEQQRPATQVAPPSSRGPSEIELLAALYSDQEVRGVLDRHGIPVVTTAGPPWKRLPGPQPLTAGLVSDLYEGCGLGLHHIELLTGRPAAAAGALLRASGIKLRPPGGRSPFMDRWRPARE
jgi:hypothetical protein